MTNCPTCQKSLQIDERFYGTLFSCPHCRAVFFVGWDGKAETPVEHPAEPVEEAPAPAPVWDPPAEEPEIEEPVQALSNSDYSFDTPIDPGAAPLEPEAAAEVSQAEPVDETHEEQVEGEVATEPPANADYSFDSPLGTEAPAEEKEPTGFADVTAFANSDAPAGALTYTITIRGLELAETFERLREALTDSRFAWDADAIMGEVRNGEVTLSRVNPAKTSILVSRLKYLALEISWRQDVFA